MKKRTLKNPSALFILILLSCILLFCFFGCGGKKTAEYDGDAVFKFGLIAAKKDGKWGFINEKGKTVIDFKFDSAENFTKDAIAPVRIEDKWSYIDTNGDFITDQRFDNAEPFSNGFASVKLNGRWGFIDRDGEMIIEPRYSKSFRFYEDGYAYVKAGSFSYVIDTEGNQYERHPEQSVFSGGYKETSYLQDKNGNDILDVEIEDIFCSYRHEEYKTYTYTVNGKKGFVDKDGNIGCDAIYDDIYSFEEDGIAIIVFEGKYGYIDYSGDVLIEPEYEYAYDFSEELAGVKLNGKFGFINKSEELIIDYTFDGVKSFSFGLAAVEMDGKWGYIDKNGEYYIEPCFDDAYDFAENGIARVKLGNKWGFIDNEGYFIIEPEFEDVSDFWNGFAKVYADGKCGFIDLEGNYLIKPKYDMMTYFYGMGLAITTTEYFDGCLGYSEYGLVNSEGKEIFPPEMDRIAIGSDGYIIVGDEESWGIYDWELNEIVPREFEEIDVSIDYSITASLLY
ncbi:MAG: WG repeat-containing protein [Clostridia bacterium]|nr:WG repeat-containing protein [Clostridia bacterium]